MITKDLAKFAKLSIFETWYTILEFELWTYTLKFFDEGFCRIQNVFFFNVLFVFLTFYIIGNDCSNLNDLFFNYNYVQM